MIAEDILMEKLTHILRLSTTGTQMGKVDILQDGDIGTELQINQSTGKYVNEFPKHFFLLLVCFLLLSCCIFLPIRFKWITYTYTFVCGRVGVL